MHFNHHSMYELCTAITLPMPRVLVETKWFLQIPTTINGCRAAAVKLGLSR